MTSEQRSLTLDRINIEVAAAFNSIAVLDCTAIGPTFAEARRAIDLEFTRPGGFVPGPSQFALADAALWYLTFGVLDRIELMAMTSDLDITFLRPASGSELFARADLLSAGSRKIVGSVRIWCDDRFDAPCAVAKGAYVLPRSGSAG